MSINKNFIKKFAKITQMGAYGSSMYVGKNDKIACDKAAVDIMRKELNKINMKGKIVIGEGELDKAPMLYIGEKVGNNHGDEFDIAVDPLEGTNFAAKNLPNALSVLAATKKGDLFKAPETYMDKIAIGKNLPNKLVDLDNSIEKNIKLLSDAKGKKITEITACLLKRERHEKIIKSLINLNVKIKFITDGDIMGALSVANQNSHIDIFIGIGGGPEGVLAAAALSCLDCQMQTRLILQNEEEKKRCLEMGIKDFDKKYYINDLIKGDVIFCATGVTDGELVKGIKVQGNRFSCETYVTHKSSNTSTIYREVFEK